MISPILIDPGRRSGRNRRPPARSVTRAISGVLTVAAVVGSIWLPPHHNSHVAEATVAPLGEAAGATHPAIRLGAPAGSTAQWTTYRIAAGSHSATIVPGTYGAAPVSGFTAVSERRYRLAFNESARYVLTQPVQPDDQFDWNKLPGLSDCGTLDLSQYGVMFGWRWRTDLSPRRLEVTAYWNVAGTHLTTPTPLLTLSEAEVLSGDPLYYEIRITPSTYEFDIRGQIEGRTVLVQHSAARGCSASITGLKWASGLYFGGTSTAPSPISAAIAE